MSAVPTDRGDVADEPTVHVRDVGQVRTITMHRTAAANALDDETVTRLRAALRELSPAGIGVVVFRSTARAFCAGFDLSDLESTDDATLLARFVDVELLLQEVAAADALTIACVDGAAIGAGADLVVACDVRLGSSRARFKFPGSRFGLVLGTRRLAQRIGAAQATAVVAGNTAVDADQALASGLLAAVVADGRALEQQATETARSVADLDRPTLRALLERLRPAADPDGDLAALVRSAAPPGLAARVAAFRDRTIAGRDPGGPANG